MPDEVEEVAGALAAPLADLVGAAVQSRQASRESQFWRLRQLALLGALRVVEAMEKRADARIDPMRRELKAQITKRDVFQQTAAVRKLLHGGGDPLAASLNAFARQRPEDGGGVDEEKESIEDMAK